MITLKEALSKSQEELAEIRQELKKRGNKAGSTP